MPTITVIPSVITMRLVTSRLLRSDSSLIMMSSFPVYFPQPPRPTGRYLGHHPTGPQLPLLELMPSVWFRLATILSVDTAPLNLPNTVPGGAMMTI